MAVSYLTVIKGFLWLPSTPLCQLLLKLLRVCSFLSKEAKPVLKFARASESPLGLVKVQIAGPTNRVSDLVGPTWGSDHAHFQVLR